MPTFNQTMIFHAPPDVVRLALGYATYPAKLIERGAQTRAIVRVRQHLHVFEWTSKGDLTTELRYRVCADRPGLLADVIDHPAVFNAPCVELTLAECDGAEACLTRIIVAVNDILKQDEKPPMPVPAPFGMGAIFLASVFVGIGGIFIVAMNWRRMGQPERFWSTLGLSPPILIFFFVIFVRMFSSATLQSWLVLLLPFLYGAIWGLYLMNWQYPAYQQWVQIYGVPTRQQQQVSSVFFFWFSVLSLASVAVALWLLRIP